MQSFTDYNLVITHDAICVIIKCPFYNDIEQLESWIADQYGKNAEYQICEFVFDRTNSERQVISNG